MVPESTIVKSEPITPAPPALDTVYARLVLPPPPLIVPVFVKVPPPAIPTPAPPVPPTPGTPVPLAGPPAAPSAAHRIGVGQGGAAGEPDAGPAVAAIAGVATSCRESGRSSASPSNRAGVDEGCPAGQEPDAYAAVAAVAAVAAASGAERGTCRSSANPETVPLLLTVTALCVT